MAERNGPLEIGAGRSGSAEASPRAARCVVLVHRARCAPEALIDSFRRRGVEVRLEHEAILALAELGRCLIEHRQRFAVDHASFHRSGSADAGSAPPSLIFILVAPGDFVDGDELLACIARSMPTVAAATFEEEADPSLRMIQRGGSSRPAASANGSAAPRRTGSSNERETPRPEIVVRRARPPLRLTPHNEDDARAHASRPAPPDLASPDAEISEHETSREPLITDEELALLLGDADESDQPPRAGGAA